jgi:hypothetical protein
LDVADLTAVTFDGDPYVPTNEPPQFQIWDMSWNYLESEEQWVVVSIELSIDEPC